MVNSENGRSYGCFDLALYIWNPNEAIILKFLFQVQWDSEEEPGKATGTTVSWTLEKQNEKNIDWYFQDKIQVQALKTSIEREKGKQ